jgi:hypothetical protein
MGCVGGDVFLGLGKAVNSSVGVVDGDMGLKLVKNWRCV